MKNYRRNRQAGGTYFFTLCLHDRQSTLLTDYITQLRLAFRKIHQKMPFTVDAMVVLPEHLHALWTLPENDADYATRIRLFKTHFSKQLPKEIKQTNNASRLRKQEAQIWQRRYWEHTIRDEMDYQHHMDYIHYNPVKHGYVEQVCDWEYSTFHREVTHGRYPNDWASDMFNNENIGE